MLSNAESLNFEKLNELDTLSKIYRLDVIAITEVQAQNLHMLKIDNFSQFIKLRPENHPLGKKGGGILFFIRNDLYPSEIPIPCLNPFDEVMWVCVRPKVLPRPFNLIVLCCFYYSPNQRSADKINFIEKLHASADFVLSKYPNAGIFLMCDANDIRLDSTCIAFNLKKVVKVPTTKGNTTLDLICTNLSKFYKPVSTLPPLGGSYHFSLFLSPLAKVKQSFSITETAYRPLTDSGLFNFGSWITTENWSTVYQTNDVDYMALSLQNLLRSNYEFHFPEKKFKTCSTDKPYVTESFKKLIRKKINFFKAGRITEANSLRKFLKKKLRKAASNYYNNKVKDLYSNKPKQWYRKIKEICGKSPSEIDFHLPEPPNKTANDLNLYLASIVQSLPPFTGSSPTIPPNTSFPFISPSDVINKILKLRKSSICPLDIPVDLIKAFSDKIAEPLSNIFNHITKFGKFPCCWKQGFITPVPKKCASLTFANIRPITLTSVFPNLMKISSVTGLGI